MRYRKDSRRRYPRIHSEVVVVEVFTQIILPLLLALIPTGGIVALFTLREKKTELMLENSAKVNKAWQEVADKESARAESLKADLEKKDEKIAEKDGIIERLHEEKSEIMSRLDVANTDCAIAKLMICDKTGCMKRRPPFGKGPDYDFHNPVQNDTSEILPDE